MLAENLDTTKFNFMNTGTYTLFVWDNFHVGHWEVYRYRIVKGIVQIKPFHASPFDRWIVGTIPKGAILN